MNIYVGNLSFDVSDEELGEAFAVYGTVTSARSSGTGTRTGREGSGLWRWRTTRRPRRAIAELNGKPIKGRPVNVNQARPREDRRRMY